MLLSMMVSKYCGETSAWPGTCAKFNARNLVPLKHHARLRCASFGRHVLQRKSYPHGQAMHQEHWSKKATVLGPKKSCAGSVGAKKTTASPEIPDKIGKHNLQTALSMIAQNAIFSKWHSLPLHTCKLERNVQEHWAHWAKKQMVNHSCLPQVQPCLTFCARSSSPSLAIEEDSCPVQASCDQIFLLLWNQLLPISCLKSMWTLTHGNWLLPKNRIIPNTCLCVHWRADCTLWWTAPFDASPPPLCMWRRLTASTCSSSSAPKNEDCLWLVANTPQPRHTLHARTGTTPQRRTT